jgi:hypothetical protein
MFRTDLLSVIGSLNLAFRGQCIVIYSCNKSQKVALFLKFILVKNSTCFEQTYCPSSGVLIWHSEDSVSWYILTIKAKKGALFLKFILVKNSTCFEQTYCPSSRVLIWHSGQCIVIYSYNKSQKSCTISQIYFSEKLYMFRTDLLPIIRSLNTVFTAIGICYTSSVDCLLASSVPSWPR